MAARKRHHAAVRHHAHKSHHSSHHAEHEAFKAPRPHRAHAHDAMGGYPRRSPHSSVRGRDAEEHLMAMRDRAYYVDYDDKKLMERMDSEMIHEDPHAISNLPQEVIFREYPRPSYYLDDVMDDSREGIDEQRMEDSRQLHRHLRPRKA